MLASFQLYIPSAMETRLSEGLLRPKLNVATLRITAKALSKLKGRGRFEGQIYRYDHARQITGGLRGVWMDASLTEFQSRATQGIDVGLPAAILTKQILRRAQVGKGLLVLSEALAQPLRVCHKNLGPFDQHTPSRLLSCRECEIVMRNEAPKIVSPVGRVV
ncbi:hypothetical protein L218DRAFT_950509 [Marasmius fiardii PR-910]|nr:hypothetical protein L218DRAFT_950509 [Marasmius fiardii PR-910]